MDETIKTQLINIQRTGESNMFDLVKVQEIALREGYFELVEYLIDHQAEYAKFILTGQE